MKPVKRRKSNLKRRKKRSKISREKKEEEYVVAKNWLLNNLPIELETKYFVGGMWGGNESNDKGGYVGVFGNLPPINNNNLMDASKAVIYGDSDESEDSDDPGDEFGSIDIQIDGMPQTNDAIIEKKKT